MPRKSDEVTPAEATRLKAYWYAVRKPRVVHEAGVVSLVLPGYFGDRPWSIPVDRVAVRDLSSAPLPEDIPEPEPVLARQVTIPYLFTTGPLTLPNLLLMFTEPQRVPPLRLGPAMAPNSDLPFGYFSTRAERGAYVDGVKLRAENPSGLERLLLAAGATRFEDPVRWLHRHRQVITDAADQERITRRRVVGHRIQLAAAFVWVPAVIGEEALIGEDGPLWAILLLLAVIVGTLGLSVVGGRRAR
ncbi:MULTISPECIES: hypothetical protein [Frankia]|uniref:Uncharacterized protein n=1 Tax=Frankia alni (strain DSM 45986 / CECT 9034 / ACN14a) TaxID=326424 RepID=Q0RT79_FRAAA|nr:MULTISPECIES: hypothetical protein [Frankia]CAJ59222.1 hypothetical protein FRAAL0547 [Frankia alni ACN14a]